MAESTSPVELIAGEMRLWSDDRPDAVRPAAGGPVAAALVAHVLAEHPGRVLVAGPHAAEVTAAVAASGHEAVYVLRSLSDAELLAARHPRARVVCGGLDAFVSEPFDVVVALDGVERVLSNDSPSRSWRERTGLLVGLVSTGGVVLDSVDNPLSVLEFADARPPAERRDTGDWEPPAYVDPTRPAELTQALETLTGLGLTGRGFASFPLTTAPAVLADVETADLTDLRVQHSLTASSARMLHGRELLFDPVPETLRAIGAGRGTELAPGWVLVLTRGEELVGSLPDTIFEDHPGRPGAIVTGLVGGEASALTTPGATGPLREQEIPGDDVTAGRLSRRDVPGGRAPAGRLLATVLADLALEEDLPTLRGVAGRYLTRTSELAAEDAGAATLLTPDNVVTVAGGNLFLPLDPSWTWTAEPAPEVAVARVALATARALLDRRLRRIWPPWTGVPELGRSLAAMADLSYDEETWRLAGDLDAVLAQTEPPDVLDRDLRSLRLLNAQLTTELESARGQVFAHERLAENRDRQLEQRSNRLHEAERRAQEAQQEAEAVRESTTYRVGRGIRHPGQAARAVVRRFRKS